MKSKDFYEWSCAVWSFGGVQSVNFSAFYKLGGSTVELWNCETCYAQTAAWISALARDHRPQ